VRVGGVTGTAVEVGFYGKLPSHGDFLRRRLPDAFVAPWDAWLQDCMAASRASLDGRWLDVFLTSPVWRFVCAPGACGPLAMVGVLAPSVDRAGRYFPLTLAAPLPSWGNVLAAARLAAPFFARAERLIVETLGAERVDLQAFDAGTRELAFDVAPVAAGPHVVLHGAAADLLDAEMPAWQLSLPSSAGMADAFEQLLAQRLGRGFDPVVLWWSEGSSLVEPSSLVTRGLPSPQRFAALLDGGWTGRGWSHHAAHLQSTAGPAPATAVDLPTLRSAAATHAGRVRPTNQDAFLERADAGVWVVADGLGAHRHGEIASRMVCDALGDMPPEDTFDDLVELTRRRVGAVNEYLLQQEARRGPGGTCGTTVVIFLARGTQGAVLWAGDSRAYRLRDGTLEQLTCDHVPTRAAGASCHAVTRAVGCQPGFALDLRTGDVRVGDRYLLCSDGLTRCVADADIQRCIEGHDPDGGVAALLDRALRAGAPDNVTALLVAATR
jgi:type VI secretion system protein ImpM